MGLFSKFCESNEEINTEDAVLICVKLSDGRFGTCEERTWCYRLEDRLIEEIDKHQSGEFDGHEFGQEYCTFYMYGKNAEILYNSILNVFEEFRLPPMSYVIKRCWGAEVAEERIEFD